MNRTRTLPTCTAFGFSVLVHVTVAVLLMRATFRVPPTRDLIRVSLLAPAPGVGPGAPAASPPAPVVVDRPEAPPQKRTPVRSRVAKKPPADDQVRRKIDAAPASASAPVPDAPPPAASVVTGDGTGDGGGAAHGVGDGTRGGDGGSGTGPRRLADVAVAPLLLHHPLPEYPRRARVLAVEGQVLLEVVLDTEGSVEDGARVVASIPLLDEAALVAVRRWRFRPARDRSGRPVRVVMEVPVRFVLR